MHHRFNVRMYCSNKLGTLNVIALYLNIPHGIHVPLWHSYALMFFHYILCISSYYRQHCSAFYIQYCKCITSYRSEGSSNCDCGSNSCGCNSYCGYFVCCGKVFKERQEGLDEDQEKGT